MAQWGERLDHPDLRVAASTMRETWRNEQDAASAEAMEEWRHQKTLRDIALETVHRGDPVVITLPHVNFYGNVEAVGPDLIALRSVSGRVDVHVHEGIPLVLQIGERVKDG